MGHAPRSTSESQMIAPLLHFNADPAPQNNGGVPESKKEEEKHSNSPKLSAAEAIRYATVSVPLLYLAC